MMRLDVPRHVPGPVDTVRYNRDDYGIKLHVPAGWKGRPLLIVPGSTRAVPLEPLDTTEFRGRLKAGAKVQYAFWLGPAKYKSGAVGAVLDKTGVHDTAAPDWFEQSAGDYPERKPPTWPSLGCVFYALDTDHFGEKIINEAGALSLAKHMDYVQGLGVTGIWLTGERKDADDALDTAKRADFKVISETVTPVKGSDGIASPTPPDSSIWRIATSQGDAHATSADTYQDRRWANSVYRFVRDDSVRPSHFDLELRHLREDYPDSAAAQLIMRLGGPGQTRPSGVLKGDAARLTQLWTLLFSLPGIPVFDAGDEIGLFDADTPMLWDSTRQDRATLDLVKKLVLARTTRPSLYRGSFTTLLTDDDAGVYAFERQDRFETTVAIFNNGNKAQEIRIPSAQFGSATLRDLIGSTSFSVSGAAINLTLAGHTCVLLGT